jgi:hypothetical protein
VVAEETETKEEEIEMTAAIAEIEVETVANAEGTLKNAAVVLVVATNQLLEAKAEEAVNVQTAKEQAEDAEEKTKL